MYPYKDAAERRFIMLSCSRKSFDSITSCHGACNHFCVLTSMCMLLDVKTLSIGTTPRAVQGLVASYTSCQETEIPVDVVAHGHIRLSDMH